MGNITKHRIFNVALLLVFVAAVVVQIYLG